MTDTHFGLTGLAVMGANLARNVAHHDIPVAVHNRTTAKTERFMAEHGGEGPITGTGSVQEFVAALERPRTIMVMVKAGPPVDAVIDELAPLLEECLRRLHVEDCEGRVPDRVDAAVLCDAHDLEATFLQLVDHPDVGVTARSSAAEGEGHSLAGHEVILRSSAQGVCGCRHRLHLPGLGTEPRIDVVGRGAVANGGDPSSLFGIYNLPAASIPIRSPSPPPPPGSARSAQP